MFEPFDPSHRLLPPRRGVVITEGVVLDGRYRLDQLIGRGGTAEVFRGTDGLLGRAVAVKVFDSTLTDLNSVERQQTEMKVLASLSHPHLVAVHDAHIAAPADPADSSGRTYLVMELVVGTTLAERLRGGALQGAESVRIGAAMANALAFIHARALVHRDIKPGNVLLARTGEVKLGDFGLARLLSAEHRVTTSADVMGTATYFSPEQARGADVGSASDVYSLGLVLLECVTGIKEFPGLPVQAAVARLLRDPVVPRHLTLPWPDLLTAMTDSSPGRRPSAADVAAVLADADHQWSPAEPGPIAVLGSGDDVESAGVTAQSGPMSFLFADVSAAPPHASGRRGAWWIAALAAVAAMTISVAAVMGSSTGAGAPASPPAQPAASPIDRQPASAATSPTGHATPAPTKALIARPFASTSVPNPVSATDADPISRPAVPPVPVRTTGRQVAATSAAQPSPAPVAGPISTRTALPPSSTVPAPSSSAQNPGNGKGNGHGNGKPKKPKG